MKIHHLLKQHLVFTTEGVRLFTFQNRYWIILIIAIIFSNFFSAWYVRQEKYIYIWDLAHYWDFYKVIGEKFSNSPWDAFRSILGSILYADYNYLPVLFLMPFYFFCGDSRIAYILALTNTFLIPTTLILTFVAEQIVNKFSGHKMTISVFFGIFLTNLLFWLFWAPVLRGFAVSIGTICIGLIFLIYIQEPIEKQKLQFLIIMGMLLFLLAINRRWYNIWVLSFFLAAFLERLVFTLRNNFEDFKQLSKLIKNIFIIGITYAILMLIFAGPLVLRVIKTNYVDLYSGFQLPFYDKLIDFERHVGLLYIIFSLAGIFLALTKRPLRSLMFFLLVQAAFTYFIFTRIQAVHVHEYLLFAPTIMIIISLFVDRILWFIKNNYLRLCFLTVYLILIMISFGLVFIPSINLVSLYSYALPNVRYYPLQRGDISNVYQIIDTIEDILAKDPNQSIYILSNSYIFDEQVLTSAARLKKGNSILLKNIKHATFIDRRDGFPMGFLESKYIVITDPIQYSTFKKYQKVISIPANKIINSEGIGTHYRKLPYKFNIDGNVKVFIYERVTDLKYVEIKDFIDEFITRYPDWSEKLEILPLSLFLKDMKIDDEYGKISFSGNSNIFIHPGKNKPTEVSFNLNKQLKKVKISMDLQGAPENCENEAGEIELIVRGDKKEILRRIVSKDQEQEVEILLKDVDALDFIASNHDSSTCDSVKIKMIEQEWVES